MKESEYKVALVGAGIIASNHIKAIRSMGNMKLAAIADINLERAKNVAADLHVQFYDDYQEMIVKEKPDLAVIVLPHYLHREAVLFGAEQGCHMLLEKPMAINLQECDEMIEVIASSDVKVMVGHTQHYLPQNLLAKQLVEQEDLGRMIMIKDMRHSHYFRPERPDWFLNKAKSGGGIVMNIGAHCIDRIQWLGGSRITSVIADLTYLGNRGNVEGSGLIFARNERGVACVISLVGYQGVLKNEYELFFAGGSIRVDAASGVWMNRTGVYEHVTSPGKENPFILQYKDMVKYMEDGQEPYCSLTYARSVVAVIESIYHSAQVESEQQVDNFMPCYG